MPRLSTPEKKIKNALNRRKREMEKRKQNPEYRIKYLEQKKEYYTRIKNKVEEKEKRAAQKAKQYALNRGFCAEYKEKAGCERCGEKSHFSCLHFHHIGEKSFEIADCYNNKNLEQLKEEISKCIVLCANCHEKHHFNENWMDLSYTKKYKENRKFAIDFKTNSGCKSCGEKDHRCLQFHHNEPNTKIAEVSSLYKKCREIVESEIKKCEVFCANCHLKFHHEEKKMNINNEVLV